MLKCKITAETQEEFIKILDDLKLFKDKTQDRFETAFKDMFGFTRVKMEESNYKYSFESQSFKPSHTVVSGAETFIYFNDDKMVVVIPTQSLDKIIY